MSDNQGTENTRGSHGGKRNPLAGFGLFQSLLLAAATGFFIFFLATALAIFALLAWNLSGNHAVSYAVSYRYIGLPAGVAALAAAWAYFIVSWVRRKLRNR
jgi:hypothetical protein